MLKNSSVIKMAEIDNSEIPEESILSWVDEGNKKYVYSKGYRNKIFVAEIWLGVTDNGQKYKACLHYQFDPTTKTYYFDSLDEAKQGITGVFLKAIDENGLQIKGL